MSAPRDVREQNEEIREWGRANGYAVAEAGRIPAELRSAWATANGDAIEAPDPVVFGIPPQPAAPDDGDGPGPSPSPTPGSDQAGPAPEPTGELPPQPPPRAGAAERARRAWRTRREQAPRRGGPARRRRVTLETLGSLAWGGLARLTEFAGPRYVPVMKMMAFEAPVAGMVVDEVVPHGSLVDRALQPVARLVEGGSAGAALIAPPLLTALACRRPDMMPVIRPMLKSALKEWVITAGPQLRRLREREAKFAAEMATFGEEYGITIDQLLDEIFAPVPSEQEMARAAANGAPPG